MRMQLALLTGSVEKTWSSSSLKELEKLSPITQHGYDIVQTLLSPRSNTQGLIQYLAQSRDPMARFCNIENFGYYLPKSKKNFMPEEVQSIICSVDYSRLSEEIASVGQRSRPPMPHMTDYGSNTKAQFKTRSTTNIEDLIRISGDISDLMERVPSRELHIFGGTSQEWMNLVDTSVQEGFPLLSPDSPVKAAGYSGAVGAALMSQSLPAPVVYGMEELLDAANEKLSSISHQGGAVTFDRLFPRSPHANRAVNELLPQIPRIFEILLWSSSGYGVGQEKVNQFQEKLAKAHSAEDAKMMICGRYVSLSQYFYHPTLTETEWRQLQSPVCFVLENWERIKRELSTEINFDRITRKSEQAGDINTNSLLDKMSEFSHLLDKASRGSLHFEGIPPDFQNSYFWEDILSNYERTQEKMLTSTKQIVYQLNNLDKAIPADFPLWWEFKTSVGNVLNALSSQMATLANRGPAAVLQLKDLVPESLPALQNWMVESVRLSPVVVESLLEADIKDPEKFRRAYFNSNIWSAEVCRSVEGFSGIFEIPRNHSDQLRQYFCGTNWRRLFVELQRFLDFNSTRFEHVLRRPLDASLSGNNRSQMTWERIFYNSEAFSQSLRKVIENDPSFQLPYGTDEQWGELIQKLMDTMTLVDVKNLPEFMTTIPPVMDKVYPNFKYSPLWSALYPYLSASETLTDFLNAYLSDGSTKVLSEPEKLREKLRKDIGLSPRAADLVVASIIRYPDTINQLLAASDSDLRGLFCDRHQAQLMFHLLDLSYFISNDLCGKNVTEFRETVAKHMNLTHLIAELANPWPKLDEFEFNRFYDAHKEFSEQMAKFASRSQYWNEEAWKQFLYQVVEAGGQGTKEMINGLRHGQMDRFGILLDDVMPMLNSDTMNEITPALETMETLARVASDSASQEEMFVALDSVLPTQYDFSEFLTRTYDQVPLFVEAFRSAEIDANMIARGAISRAFGDFCRNGSLGSLFRFPDSVDTRMLSRSLCNINYQSIITELSRKLQPEKAPIQRDGIGSNDVISDFVRLLKDSISGWRSNIRSAPISVSGSRFLRNYNTHRNTKEWSNLEIRLGQLLQSAELVLAGSQSGQGLQSYARQISALANMMRNRDNQQAKGSVVLLRSILNDTVGFSNWVETNLAIDRKTTQKLLSSYVHPDQIRNVRNVCSGGKVRSGIFVAVNRMEKQQWDSMLCKMYFPVLLEQIHYHMAPASSPPPDVSPRTTAHQGPINWNVVLNDLSYLASRDHQLRSLLPGVNGNDLLSIRGDLSILLQDLAPYDSETDSATAEDFLVKYGESINPLVNAQSKNVSSSKVVSQGKTFTHMLGAVNRRLQNMNGKKFTISDLIGDNSLNLRNALLNNYGWKEEEIQSLFQSELSFSMLKQLSSPSGVQHLCTQTFKSLLGATGLDARNRLCHTNSTDAWKNIIQNIDVKNLSQMLGIGSSGWPNLFSGSGNIMRMFQGLSGQNQQSLQAAFNSGKLSNTMESYLNSLGVAALKTFQNLPSIMEKTMSALETVLSPMADVNLRFDSIIKDESLTDELFNKLALAGQNASAAITTEKLSSLANHSAEFRSLLYDAVCDIGRFQPHLCTAERTADPICELRADIRAALKHGLPTNAAVQVLAGRLCSSFVTDWRTIFINSGIHSAQVQQTLTMILNAYVVALKQVHAITEIEHAQSKDMGTVVAPHLLSNRVARLKNTIETLKGGASWTGLIRDLFTAIPSMPDESRRSISNSIKEIASIYTDDNGSPGGNSPFRRLNDDVLSASSVLQKLSLTDDGQWQEFSAQISSIIRNLAEGKFPTQFEPHDASGHGQQSEMKQMIDTCTRVSQSLDQGVGMKQVSTLAQTLAEQLNSFTMYKKTVCALPNLDTRDLYEATMYDLNWANALKKIQLSNGVTGTKNCTEYALSMAGLWNSLFQWGKLLNGPDGRQLGKCIREADTTVFKALDRYLELASGISRMVSEPDLAQQVSELQPKFQDFVGIIEKNVPIFAPIENYIFDLDKLDYQLATFNVSAAARAAILQANVDMTYLEKIKSVQELETVLCDASRLRRLIQANKTMTWTSWNSLSSQLCSAKRAAVTGVLFSGLDFDKLTNELPRQKQNKLMSVDWILQVAQRGSKLIEGAVNLNEKSKDLKLSYLSALTDANKQGRDLEMDNLVQMAEGLVNDAASILGGSSVVNDFQKVLDGITGLKVIKSVLLPSSGIKNMAANQAVEIRAFLMSHLGYSVNETERLMDLGIDLISVVLSVQRNTTMVCNNQNSPTTISSDSLILKELISRLCQYDLLTLRNISFGSLQEAFNPSLFMKEYVRKAMERKLETAGMSRSDAREALTEIRRLPELLPLLTDGGNDDYYSSQLKTRTLALTSNHKQRNTNPAVYAGRMFCGRDLTEELESLRQTMFADSDASRKPHRMNVKDRRELNQLPSSYCQEIYKSLVSFPGGKLLWSYIKPLIRGEISIVPDTVEARHIIKEANATFIEIFSWVELIQSSSRANAMFNDMDNSSEELKKLEATLKHPFVRGALQETLNVDAGDLVTSLKSASKLPPATAKKLEMLAEMVKNISSCVSFDRFKFYKSENHWKESMQFVGQNDNILAAVIFDSLIHQTRAKRSIPDIPNEDKLLPKHIQYTIRMDHNTVPKTNLLLKGVTDQLPNIPFVSNSPYLYGFVQLQDMIDSAIIRLQVRPEFSSTSALYAEKLPLPCSERDLFVSHLKNWLPLFMIAAWILSVGVLVSSFVRDVDTGIAQILSVMGLRSSVGFFGWFFTSFSALCLVSSLITFVLKAGLILPLTNWMVIILLMLNFSVALIMMSYFISSFFDKTTLAALTGVIIYLMSYLPFLIINMTEGWKISFFLRLLSCLSAPAAFSFSCAYMASWEQAGSGLQWSNIGASVWPEDKLSFSMTFLMLLFDSCLYGVAAYIVSHARNKKCDTQCCMLSWFGCFKGNSVTTASTFDIDSDDFSRSSVTSDSHTTISEPVSEASDEIAVCLRHLCKTFHNKRAVHDMSLNLYNGQITGLLGQNGAGKSTTIKMLTGITKPTSGTALIRGSVAARIKNLVGLCPQENILFERLTVKEHMKFYGKLKGNMKHKELDDDIERLLDQTKLQAIKNVQVHHLSGGMRRRLCVGLAFVGGSQVVILDEPTAGVDPVARRAIWDIITDNKNGRTILISTHYLDEADLLSDRIAVVHQGRLLCCGSSGFLKDRFGSGYHMTISRSAGTERSRYAPETLEKYLESSGRLGSSSSGRDAVRKLHSFICRFVPNAEIIDQSKGSEVTVALPPSRMEREGSTRLDLAELFGHIDENLEQLGIESYGVSNTTLEEVFLTICYLADNKMDLNKTVDERITALKAAKETTLITPGAPYNSEFRISSIDEGLCSVKFNGKSVFTSEEAGKIDGSKLKLQQIKALLLKRFHHSRRDWKLLVSGILLPCLFVFMAMALNLLRPEQDHAQRLVLTPEIYGPGMNMFYAFENFDSRALEKGLASPDGIGIGCLPNADESLKDKCGIGGSHYSTDYASSVVKSKYNGRLKQCTCESGGQVCPSGAEGVLTPRQKTNFSNWLYDYSEPEMSYGLPNYLLRTYRKNEDMRFGGWSFGTEKPGTSRIKIWFDEMAVHGIPSFISAANNIRLRAAAEENVEQYGISTYSHPYKFGKSGKVATETLTQRIADVGIGLVLLCAYSFIPAAAIIYVVQERLNKERHLQSLCGVGPLLYWSVSFFWDFLLYTMATLIGALIMAMFQLPIYTAKLNLLATTVLILCYGLSCLPLMYLLQRLFHDGTISYLILFCLSVFLGLNTMVCTVVMNVFYWNPSFAKAYSIQKVIFLFFPQFCLTGGLVELARNQIRSELLDTGYREDSVYENPFSFNVIGSHCLALLVQSVMYFLLSVLLDFKRPWNHKKSKIGTEDLMEDEEVASEAMRVLNSEQTDSLRVLNLRKVYRSGLGKNVAVKNLSLGVRQGEVLSCFGLLGVNGAGKSTTFKMLCGDLPPSSGAAYLYGKSLTKSPFRTDQNLGYCPQEDACDPLLTSKELLEFYARLRGYPRSNVSQVAKLWLKRLDLEHYADTVAHVYSGGTKRKLCVAAALLGKPQMVLMDEPTAGMDPSTRRIVWSNIDSVLKEGRSILLTSHSMEECDAVCGRLSIMVNGRLKCIGSPHHLKHRFGDGYTVSVRVMSHEDLPALYSLIQERFPFVTMREEHFCSVELLFPPHTVPLPKIFSFFDSNKTWMRIRDYSVSQATLDQVFVSFAKQQTDGAEEDSVSDTATYANPTLVLRSEPSSRQRESEKDIPEGKDRL